MLTWVTCPPQIGPGCINAFRLNRGGRWHGEEALPSGEIISKLCEADVLISQGKKVVKVIKDGCGNVVRRTGQPLGGRIQ